NSFLIRSYLFARGLKILENGRPSGAPRPSAFAPAGRRSRNCRQPCDPALLRHRSSSGTTSRAAANVCSTDVECPVTRDRSVGGGSRAAIGRTSGVGHEETIGTQGQISRKRSSVGDAGEAS